MNINRDFQITLVLHGELSHDLSDFWNTFIEIQTKLPAESKINHIVIHSLNPKLKDLIKLVYAPKVVSTDAENQPIYDYFNNYLNENFLKANQNSKRKKLLYNYFNSTLSESYSRECAIKLLNKNSYNKNQILIAKLSLRDSRSGEVKKLPYFGSLPHEYIYLPNSSEVDMGYSDAWMLTNYEVASKFEDFYQFVKDSLGNKNAYLNLFLYKGWPNSYQKNNLYIYLPKVIKQKLQFFKVNIFEKKLQQILTKLEHQDNYILKILRRIIRNIHKFSTTPKITAENSYINKFKCSPTIYSKENSLDIRSLLKFYILDNNLRHQVRFLDAQDFEISHQNGKLINPEKLILIIYGENSLSTKLFINSPFPLTVVYKIEKNEIYEYHPNSERKLVYSFLENLNISLKIKIEYTFKIIENYSYKKIPIVLVPDIKNFVNCEIYYLNALLKYFKWKKMDFVVCGTKMVSTNCKNFPDLNTTKDIKVLIEPSVGSLNGFINYFNDTANYTKPVTNKNEFPNIIFGSVNKNIF